MDTQVIDDNALEELRGIMGEDFPLLIETFLNDSVARIKAISEALANADAEALRTAAHSFKGSSLNISAIRLIELCKDLEDRGRENRLQGAEAVLEQVELAFADVKAYLI